MPGEHFCGKLTNQMKRPNKLQMPINKVLALAFPTGNSLTIFLVALYFIAHQWDITSCTLYAISQKVKIIFIIIRQSFTVK